MARFLVKVMARVSPAIVSTEIEIDDDDVITEEQAKAEAIEVAKEIEDWEGKWGNPSFSSSDLDKDSITVDEVEKIDDFEDE